MTEKSGTRGCVRIPSTAWLLHSDPENIKAICYLHTREINLSGFMIFKPVLPEFLPLLDKFKKSIYPYLSFMQPVFLSFLQLFIQGKHSISGINVRAHTYTHSSTKTCQVYISLANICYPDICFPHHRWQYMKLTNVFKVKKHSTWNYQTIQNFH